MFLVSICNARFLGVPGAIVSVSLLLELGVPLSSSHTTIENVDTHLQRDLKPYTAVSYFDPSAHRLDRLKDYRAAQMEDQEHLSEGGENTVFSEISPWSKQLEPAHNVSGTI